MTSALKGEQSTQMLPLPLNDIAASCLGHKGKQKDDFEHSKVGGSPRLAAPTAALTVQGLPRQPQLTVPAEAPKITSI